MTEYIEREEALNAIIEKLIVQNRELSTAEEACNIGIRKAASAVANLPAIEGLSVDRMKELAKAEAEGRLIVLPCKVGDTVYVINNRHIEHCKVARFVISSYGCGTRGEDLYQHIVFELSQLGKTVFLTREEAEAALRKESANNGN